MGIVLNQSFKNTIITYIGFGIGAINTLYLYPVYLGATYYGLTNYITSCCKCYYAFICDWNAKYLS